VQPRVNKHPLRIHKIYQAVEHFQAPEHEQLGHLSHGTCSKWMYLSLKLKSDI
jgi:hypothetical protein